MLREANEFRSLNERFLTIILAVQMLSALGMIGLILIQHGKGVPTWARPLAGRFGSLFGASGSANFLSRTTGVWLPCSLSAPCCWPYFGNLRPVSSGSVLGALR